MAKETYRKENGDVIEVTTGRKWITTKTTTNRCKRCGGQGSSSAWVYTGSTCYECGGSGIKPHSFTVKVPTAEYQKILDAEKEARDNTIVYIAIGNTYEIKDKLKADGYKWHQFEKVWVGENEVNYCELLTSKRKDWMETIENYNLKLKEAEELKVKELLEKASKEVELGSKVEVEVKKVKCVWSGVNRFGAWVGIYKILGTDGKNYTYKGCADSYSEN